MEYRKIKMENTKFGRKTKQILENSREIIVGVYLLTFTCMFLRFVVGSLDMPEQDDLQVWMCRCKEHLTYRGLAYEVVIIVDTLPEGGKSEAVCKNQYASDQEEKQCCSMSGPVSITLSI